VESLLEIWNRQTQQAKIGLIVGTIVIVALTVGLGLWAYRTEYQVLFSDLSPQDAAMMTGELDRAKTPYQLADNGNTILVPKEIVYKTRLKLMEKDVPLHGAVGFEVFNNADLGMTDFVQKVNYQRAIQGELTRTILSIDGVAAARVHLAMPEQSLFKKSSSKPKASVTVTTKRGTSLLPEQVAGIQRLVAASVPDIVAEDVTVLDQHGVALTRPAGADGELAFSGTQLDAKRSTEDYLTKKVSLVLDRALGPGEAIATVDVALNMDQSRVTTEEVLPAKTSKTDDTPTGVVVRERQTSHDAPSAASLTDSHASQSGEVTSYESEYQVGRRVEQVTSAAGSVSHMTVAVVVKRALDDAQLEHLKEVVSLALGVNPQRGDAVAVYTMDKVANTGTDLSAKTGSDEATATVPDATRKEKAGGVPMWLPVFYIVAGGLAAAILVALWFARTGARRQGDTKRLSATERERMLSDLRTWIDHGSVSAEAKATEVNP
jgi:flagellar M-ring protein FliF